MKQHARSWRTAMGSAVVIVGLFAAAATQAAASPARPAAAPAGHGQAAAVPHRAPGGLKILIAHRHLKPGARVAFAVRLVIRGKPAFRHLVQMSLSLSPGKSGRLAPRSGMTNRRGVLRGTLVLSKLPGLTVLVATSGNYAAAVDLSTVAQAKQDALPFGLGHGTPVAVWLATAGVALVLLGVVVDLGVVGLAILHALGWLSRPVRRLFQGGGAAHA